MSVQFPRRLISVLMIIGGAVTTASYGESPKAPPGFTMSRTGSPQDFDYFEGAWTTVQHKRSSSGPDKGSWRDFPGNLCMQLRLAGNSNIGEIYFPTTRTAGLTVRLFDPAKRQWSIYWASSTTGILDPVPVVGGFTGQLGEFYASDRIGGKPVKVRYLWTIQDHDHAKWEQAISYDDLTWDTNWTADFTRGDAAELCTDGVPRR